MHISDNGHGETNIQTAMLTHAHCQTHYLVFSFRTSTNKFRQTHTCYMQNIYYLIRIHTHLAFTEILNSLTQHIQKFVDKANLKIYTFETSV